MASVSVSPRPRDDAIHMFGSRRAIGPESDHRVIKHISILVYQGEPKTDKHHPAHNVWHIHLHLENCHMGVRIRLVKYQDNQPYQCEWTDRIQPLPALPSSFKGIQWFTCPMDPYAQGITVAQCHNMIEKQDLNSFTRDAPIFCRDWV